MSGTAWRARSLLDSFSRTFASKRSSAGPNLTRKKTSNKGSGGKLSNEEGQQFIKVGSFQIPVSALFVSASIATALSAQQCNDDMPKFFTVETSSEKSSQSERRVALGLSPEYRGPNYRWVY